MMRCFDLADWSRKLLSVLLGLMVLTALLWPRADVLASSTDGVIDPLDKYAWAENIGWITFGEPGGNVHLTDETDPVAGGAGGGLGGGGYWTGGETPDAGQTGDQDDASIEQGTLHQSAEDPQNACQMDFVDVGGHWAYRPIEQLYCQSIVSGRAPGLFVPDDGATRAEITKMALLMNGYQVDLTAESSFPDVDGEHWAYRYIATAERLGVVNGYGDGFFRPDDRVSRAELVKIFLLAAGESLPERYSYSFADVPVYAWYYPYVSLAFRLDVLSGYPDGTFRPDQDVTRAEAAKIAVYLMSMP